MGRLIMTVGLPRSGKSTWSREQGAPIVNPDSIRLEVHGKIFEARHEQLVWWFAQTMVASLFRAGHAFIILDATSVTKKARDIWRAYDRTFVVFEPNIELCKSRAVATGTEYLIPTIDRMAGEFVMPSADEGPTFPPSWRMR